VKDRLPSGSGRYVADGAEKLPPLLCINTKGVPDRTTARMDKRVLASCGAGTVPYKRRAMSAMGGAAGAGCGGSDMRTAH